MFSRVDTRLSGIRFLDLTLTFSRCQKEKEGKGEGSQHNKPYKNFPEHGSHLKYKTKVFSKCYRKCENFLKKLLFSNGFAWKRLRRSKMLPQRESVC